MSIDSLVWFFRMVALELLAWLVALGLMMSAMERQERERLGKPVAKVVVVRE